MVASDRISAFDFVLEPGIPDKGELLTRMSLWWFDQLEDLVPNHMVSTEVPERVRGRAVICEKLEMFPVECVVRGYLTGSGLIDYNETGEVCGVALPPGLVDGRPAARADLHTGDQGRDGRARRERLVRGGRRDDRPRVRQRAARPDAAVYARAEEIARERGIILADTKLEFGARADGTIVLADEVLTPDSSRFWPADEWQPGRTQPSYDKQYVRNWLLSPESGWDRPSNTQPPDLPAEIVAKTRERYIQAYEQLTGLTF